MRPMNQILIGAILAAAPMLVAPQALADDDNNSSEECGGYDLSGDAHCELLVGGECEAECDEADMNSQAEESCSEECEGGGLQALFCLVTCIPETLLDLESSCSAGCSGEGSLFCDDVYLSLDDVGQCVDELCSLGLNVGEACE